MNHRPAEVRIVDPSDSDVLSKQEERISNATARFYAEIGDALRIIRDGRLYFQGHSTFEEYCHQRWNMNRDYANKMIRAAEFAGSLDTIVSKPTAESQIRPILQLPKAEQESAWKEAVETAPKGKVTAKHVQAVVDKRKPFANSNMSTRVDNNNPDCQNAPSRHQSDEPAIVDAWDQAIESTTAKQEDVRPKTSIVDGKRAADPPDVAKLRAAGKIGADVVVEVTTTGSEDSPESEPEPEVDDATLPDDEWLATLPLSAELRNVPLRTFHRDALVYRQLERPRAAYRHHAIRVLNADRRKPGATGEYAFRVSRFLRMDHPKSWHKCPPAEHGGCGGAGQIPPIGECPKCRGRGYWIA